MSRTFTHLTITQNRIPAYGAVCLPAMGAAGAVRDFNSSSLMRGAQPR